MLVGLGSVQPLGLLLLSATQVTTNSRWGSRRYEYKNGLTVPAVFFLMGGSCVVAFYCRIVVVFSASGGTVLSQPCFVPPEPYEDTLNPKNSVLRLH